MTKKKKMSLNYSQIRQLIYLVSIFIVFSCNSYPESPSKVVEKFTEYLANGECNAAMDLCEENAKQSVQGNIDAGCDPYETTVDSVICDITNNEAICYCYESREGFNGIRFPYELEKINDKWKIVENTKDIGAPSFDSLDLGNAYSEIEQDLNLIEEIENSINESDSAINSILSK